MMDFCCTLSVMLLSLVLLLFHILSCKEWLFFLPVLGFLLNVEEKCFRICNFVASALKGGLSQNVDVKLNLQHANSVVCNWTVLQMDEF